ncbi:MAG TPA: hypothetical protein VEX86_02890 [Longimicrobium sp.]|nr:hypothetical protein [Longimicrobium sp.]
MQRDDEPRGLGGEYDPGFRPGERGAPGDDRPSEPVPQRPRDDAWPADDESEDPNRVARMRRDPSAIRTEDTEPYVGLQYVARLFKVVAMVVIVALTAEIVAAVVMEGLDALLPLFLELLQGAVLAAVLWGASDLTLLFIDVGHDVRASRVLLGRMTARAGASYNAAADDPTSVVEQRRTPRRSAGDEGTR